VPAFRRQLPAAALAAALLAACGGGPAPGPPEKLSQEDSNALTSARKSLDAAIKTEARLSDSPQAARKLRGEVQAIVSEGAFETTKLDQFGLAALGRLALVVPSLAEVDSDGVPVALDVEATRAFLRFAERDPARALLVPAEQAVGAIERTVERSEAGPETRILPEDQTASLDLSVADYLREAEDDTQPIWKALSGRLRVLRAGL